MNLSSVSGAGSPLVPPVPAPTPDGQTGTQGRENCPHLDLSPVAVSVIAPLPGFTPVECPCCHLPGYVGPEDEIDGMRCPYCDVQAVSS